MVDHSVPQLGLARVDGAVGAGGARTLGWVAGCVAGRGDGRGVAAGAAGFGAGARATGAALGAGATETVRGRVAVRAGKVTNVASR